MAIQISFDQGFVEGEVTVPLSKSESNRILLIKALAGFDFKDDIFSDSGDTRSLLKGIMHEGAVIHAGEGAATAKFLMAYFAFTCKDVVITGSEGLLKRPMQDTVDLLIELGADIRYEDKENFLPVRIYAVPLKPKSFLFCNGKRSSQHISAAMMLAPLLGTELTIEITGEALSSYPYIELTASIMQKFGADVKLQGNKVTIGNTPYTHSNCVSGGDWSAASYFYEIAALSQRSEIRIKNIDTESMQGDKKIASIMNLFGVVTTKQDSAILLTKKQPTTLPYFTDDFIHTPDIALTVAATCSGLNVKADLQGLKNLVIKESDRVSCFQREAYKLNVKTDFCDFSKLKILETTHLQHTSRILKTYNDHRIAMCLAPLSVIVREITLDHPEVVNKSFPLYWENLERLGFKISMA